MNRIKKSIFEKAPFKKKKPATDSRSRKRQNRQEDVYMLSYQMVSSCSSFMTHLSSWNVVLKNQNYMDEMK